MEVNGQLHFPAALPPGKLLPVHIEYEALWAPKPVWTLWKKKREDPCIFRDSNSAIQPVARQYTG
jgi:hypothetical protein